MKQSVFKDEEQLVSQAVDALIDRLGPVEANRFLSLPRAKRMESVKRHRQWQKTLDQDEFLDRVFGARNEHDTAN